jgi:short-subunit dehydrogenase
VQQTRDSRDEAQRRGTIVNTASVAAAVGIANHAAYCASKGRWPR